jgi:hypothetical protein
MSDQKISPLKRVANSRFLLFSILLHALVIVVGSGTVLFRYYVPTPDFNASLGLLGEDAVPVPAPEQPLEFDPNKAQPNVPELSVPAVSAITAVTHRALPFELTATTLQFLPTTEAFTFSGNPSTSPTPPSAGMGDRVPPTMASRMGGSARRAAMLKNNGKEKSEVAVVNSLRWLKMQQNRNGSWCDKYPATMTGLALLCYLGHGELPQSAEFGETVSKAVNWFNEQGTKFQGRLCMASSWTAGAAYEHAIGTYALCEYYTMTRDTAVVPLLRQAVQYIVEGQAYDGGWRYHYNNQVASDTSVTGWQVQALKAAHLTDLGFTGLEEAMDRAMVFLRGVQGEKGGFGYTEAGDRYPLTGVGAFCTFLWKQDRDPTVRKGVDYLLRASESTAPVKYAGPSANLYAWYYNTQACLMYGGTAWDKWNRLFQDEIADSQSAEGYWPPTGGHVPGGLEEDPFLTGQVYRTTLCVLMLEVFYRYMPIYKL